MMEWIMPFVKKLLGEKEPPLETVLYEREWKVYQALNEVLPGQPCNLGGRYSWLMSPTSGHPLQIDLFYPQVTALSGIELARPRPLAIEVQSSLHDGKWSRGKRKFFGTREAFDRYTKNQEYKRQQILARNILFIEIDPAKDDLSPKALRKLLKDAFGLPF